MKAIRVVEFLVTLFAITAAAISYCYLDKSYNENRKTGIYHHEYDALNKRLDENPSIVIPLDIFEDEKIDRDELDEIELMILESINDKEKDKSSGTNK